MFVAKDKAYTGVVNAPVVAASDVYYILDNNSYLKLVYTATAGTAVTDASELVYIVNPVYSVGKDTDKNTYYVHEAIVNGAKTTINASGVGSGRGLYKIDSYTKGYADLTFISASDTKYAVLGDVSDHTQVKYSNSTLTVDSTAYTVADDVAIYTIDTADGNTVATIGVSSLKYKVDNGFDNITLVFNKNYAGDAKVVAIYLQK